MIWNLLRRSENGLLRIEQNLARVARRSEPKGSLRAIRQHFGKIIDQNIDPAAAAAQRSRVLIWFGVLLAILITAMLASLVVYYIYYYEPPLPAPVPLPVPATR